MGYSAIGGGESMKMVAVVSIKRFFLRRHRFLRFNYVNDIQNVLFIRNTHKKRGRGVLDSKNFKRISLLLMPRGDLYACLNSRHAVNHDRRVLSFPSSSSFII